MAGRARFLVLGTVLGLAACTYNSKYMPPQSEAQAPALHKHIEPSAIDITVVDTARLNHDAQVLGIHCSAHTYHDQFEPYFKAYLASLDRDGMLSTVADPSGPLQNAVIASIKNSRSDFRCVEVSTLKTECRARKTVEISYQVSRADGAEHIERTYSAEGSAKALSCGRFGDLLATLGNDIMEHVEADIRSF